MTATPKDYIKNIDVERLKATDPRAWEKRQLLDSYKTFGCESGDPTYRYSLLDGVRDGYLINPTVVDARTDITTKLLADEGYAVISQGDEADEEQEETVTFKRSFSPKKPTRCLSKLLWTMRSVTRLLEKLAKASSSA